MRPARRVAVVLTALVLVALAASGLALAWLGPDATRWSLAARFGGADVEAAWRHVPPEAPVLAVVDVPRLVDAPVSVAVRDRLETIAARHGVDLEWTARSLSRLVVVHDGASHGFALGSGVRTSPLVLERLQSGWRRAPHPVAELGECVTDGRGVLCPLEPGIVLLAERGTAERAASLAWPGRSQEPRLRLDEPGLSLRGTATASPLARAELIRRLGPALAPLVASLTEVEADVVAGESLELELRMLHASEAGAARAHDVLRQLEATRRLARGSGGLASLLLGDDAALVLDLPPLDLDRRGSVLHAVLVLTPDELRAWLDQVLARSS